MTDNLKELAIAATPGPWIGKGVKECGYGWVTAPNGGLCTFGKPVEILKGQYSKQSDDAAYIAAASPDVVLALISDLENERRKVTELVNGYEKDQAELKRLRTTIFTDNTQTVVNAEKRIAELEADVDDLASGAAAKEAALKDVLTVGTHVTVGGVRIDPFSIYEQAAPAAQKEKP